MIKLLEGEILIKCREMDVELINSMLQDCEQEYTSIMLEETKRDYKCKLTVITTDFLDTAQEGK